MKIKSLNTKKREVLIIIASSAMLIILSLVVFLLTNSLSSKIETVYGNQFETGIENQDPKIKDYDLIIKKIFPNGVPKEYDINNLTPTSTSPSSDPQPKD